MRATCPSLLSILTLAALGLAQQPNSPNATMTWNGQGGPPYPIAGVPLPWGSSATLAISGAPYAPFALATAGALSPQGLPVLGGELLDLDPATLQLVIDPAVPPAFATGPSGVWQASGIIPILPAGIRIPYQAAVFDPTAPSLVRLTAATEVVTAPGLTVTNLSLFDDGYQLVSLAGHGLDLAFFGTSYTSFFVNSNGFVSFGAGSTDFTPSPTELQGQMPRIALQWCDLQPNASGTVTVTIDPVSSSPTVQVDFVNVPDYGGGGAIHTFSYLHFAGAVGDFVVTHAPNNMGSVFPQIVGISPGGGAGLSPFDISAAQDAGGGLLVPGLAFYEFFGTAGQANYPDPTNPFDLMGRVVWFLAQQGGAGGYFLL